MSQLIVLCTVITRCEGSEAAVPPVADAADAADAVVGVGAGAGDADGTLAVSPIFDFSLLRAAQSCVHGALLLV